MCLKKMGRKTRLCACLPVHIVYNILHIIPLSDRDRFFLNLMDSEVQCVVLTIPSMLRERNCLVYLLFLEQSRAVRSIHLKHSLA